MADHHPAPSSTAAAASLLKGLVGLALAVILALVAVALFFGASGSPVPS